MRTTPRSAAGLCRAALVAASVLTLSHCAPAPPPGAGQAPPAGATRMPPPAGEDAPLPAVSPAPSPADSQGLIRERDAKTEELRREDVERAQRELMEREQAERAARQRLDSGGRLPAPSLLYPGAPPNLSGGAVQPGFTDRAGEMARDEAERRRRLEYDSAVRAREDAERAARGALGRAAPWKPIGAR